MGDPGGDGADIAGLLTLDGLRVDSIDQIALNEPSRGSNDSETGSRTRE